MTKDCRNAKPSNDDLGLPAVSFHSGGSNSGVILSVCCLKCGSDFVEERKDRQRGTEIPMGRMVWKGVVHEE